MKWTAKLKVRLVVTMILISLIPLISIGVVQQR
jgi:hypothetical protein